MTRHGLNPQPSDRAARQFVLDPGAKGERTAEVIDQLGHLAEMGFSGAVGAVANVWQVTPLEALAADVIPGVADL